MELTDLSEAGQFITIALMLIGGSPGSTAGGLKTTTIAVLLTTAISTFRRRENANLFGRRIDDDVVKNAATISLMYITLCCTGGLIISVSEGLPMLTCLFETASAVGISRPVPGNYAGTESALTECFDSADVFLGE